MSTAVPILGMIRILCKLIVPIYVCMTIYFNYIYIYICIPIIPYKYAISIYMG
jgi:hypothetical protein